MNYRSIGLRTVFIDEPRIRNVKQISTVASFRHSSKWKLLWSVYKDDLSRRAVSPGSFDVSSLCCDPLTISQQIIIRFGGWILQIDGNGHRDVSVFIRKRDTRFVYLEMHETEKYRFTACSEFCDESTAGGAAMIQSFQSVLGNILFVRNCYTFDWY